MADDPWPDLPDPDPEGGGDPFERLDLSQLFANLDMAQVMHVLATPGPLNWQIASQFATLSATGGEDEPHVSEADREQLQELARIAQTHVVGETGLALPSVDSVRALRRQEWAALHIEALKPVLETFAVNLGQVFSPEVLRGLFEQVDLSGSGLDELGLDPDSTQVPDADQLAGLAPMLAPLLLGVQAGSMIGYLARHALGRYDLPLPASDEPSLCFVVANIDAFESDWSLDRTDLRFYVAIHEVVHAAMRSVPWVRARLVELATEYVSAYELDPNVLDGRLGESRFADLDPDDPSSLQAIAEHPEELLGALRTDRQRALLERARVFHAVLDGYGDVVLETVGRRLIGQFDRIHEAMARHRIERGEAERFVEGLLGLAADRDDYERGGAFARGVVERAGLEGLNRLWEAPDMEPTPNELAAPGLWLARIGVETELSDTDLPDLDIPDTPPES